MFFPFITGKNFTFRILVELMLGGWIILMLRDAMYRPRFSWVIGSLAAFVGIMALATVFSENPFKSFWSNFERMEGLVTLLHLFVYVLIAGTVLNTEKLWTRFWQVSVGVSTFIGLYGVFQLLGFITINQGGVRVDATLGNATYLGIYTLFHLFITAMLLLRWRGSSFVRYIYGAIILLQLVIVYFTASRGVMLGLVAGVLLTTLLIAIFERENKKIRIASASVLLIIAILAGGLIAVRNAELFPKQSPMGRLASISLKEGKSRFIIWNMAYEGFTERPMLGWGQESFNFVFNKNYNPKLFEQEPWFDRVHNVFFDWLIAGGVLGLIAYLALYITSVFYTWSRPAVRAGPWRPSFLRKREEVDEEVPRAHTLSIREKSLITGLFVAYFVSLLFVFDNIVSYILFFSLLAYIHFLSTTTGVSEGQKQFSKSWVTYIAIPIVIILSLFSVYFFNAKGVSAARDLLQSLSGQERGIEQNVELFEQALSHESFGQQEIREQLIQVAIRANTLPGVELETKQRLFTMARDEMDKQIERQPTDARLLMFMGAFLRIFGQYDEALTYLERARELSPQKQQILSEVALVNLLKDDRAEAFEVAKETYELEPESNLSLMLYAGTAIYNGQRDLAKELLVSRFGTDIVADDFLVQAYFDAREFGKLVSIWEARVQDEPNNEQFNLSLGAAYLHNGQRSKAVQQIRKVIEINPSFKDQGEFFIREIEAGRNP